MYVVSVEIEWVEYWNHQRDAKHNRRTDCHLRVSASAHFFNGMQTTFRYNFQIRLHSNCKIMIFFSFGIFIFHFIFNLHTCKDLPIEIIWMHTVLRDDFYAFLLFLDETWVLIFIWESLDHVIHWKRLISYRYYYSRCSLKCPLNASICMFLQLVSFQTREILMSRQIVILFEVQTSAQAQHLPFFTINFTYLVLLNEKKTCISDNHTRWQFLCHD